MERITEGIQFFAILNTIAHFVILTAIHWSTAFGVVQWTDDLKHRYQMLALYGILLGLIAIYLKL